VHVLLLQASPASDQKHKVALDNCMSLCQLTTRPSTLMSAPPTLWLYKQHNCGHIRTNHTMQVTLGWSPATNSIIGLYSLSTAQGSQAVHVLPSELRHQPTIVHAPPPTHTPSPRFVNTTSCSHLATRCANRTNMPHTAPQPTPCMADWLLLLLQPVQASCPAIEPLVLHQQHHCPSSLYCLTCPSTCMC
jgi:hypothetical protein